jgi:hypothetical protein
MGWGDQFLVTKNKYVVKLMLWHLIRNQMERTFIERIVAHCIRTTRQVVIRGVLVQCVVYVAVIPRDLNITYCTTVCRLKTTAW